MLVKLDLRDTREQRPVTLEVHVIADRVEFRHSERLLGVAVRETLRNWFENPWDVMVYDFVSLIRGTLSGWPTEDPGITLVVGDFIAEYLTDETLDELRAVL